MKEKMLTVLVPVTQEDVTATYQTIGALLNNVSPSQDVINNIYYIVNVDGYFRAWLNPETNDFEFHRVIDREFPYLGKPLEIFNFTYDATRMGSAPTITAQGVMLFADKDENNDDVTLEELWLASNNDCHVSFNGENFYLKQVPTCSKTNEDARYKYDIDFVSERVVLERVYLYDVVQPFIADSQLSESSKFSFYGSVDELIKRINASLFRSGLSSFIRKHVGYPQHPSIEVPYLTYEQWNMLNIDGTYLVLQEHVFQSNEEMYEFYDDIFLDLNGDYNRYLMEYIYENDNGEYTIEGYQCKLGKNKKGELTTSDEKLISFNDNTIHEALQQIHDSYNLEYYIYIDTSLNGVKSTVIMIADCEYDFADRNDEDTDYERGTDGIPVSSNPFSYGADNALLEIEKTNTTDKIVTRITGVGSEDNIPWYYPNPTADGWIKPVYSGKYAVSVQYPSFEAPSLDLEKYLKNRIGFEYIYKKNIVTYVFGASIAGLYSKEENNQFKLDVSFIIIKDEPIHIETLDLLNTYNNLEPEITIYGQNWSEVYPDGTSQELQEIEFEA